MFGDLLRQVELKQLASFASPGFFEVFSRRQLWRQGVTLLGNQRNRSAFELRKAERQAELERAGLAVRVWPPSVRPGAGAPPSYEAQRSYVRAVLTLYFHQVYTGRAWLLDLSAKALSPVVQAGAPGVVLDWKPAAWYVDWDSEFRAGLQLLYRGFYLDDDAAFDAGARRLGLLPLKHLFRQHFGERVTETRFRLSHFMESFQRIFAFCKTNGVQLRSDFVVLGACLSSLYENLERFDVTVDARACFAEGSRVSPVDAGVLGIEVGS